jgi:predicted NAD/FAD-dependent oxidoreductase
MSEISQPFSEFADVLIVGAGITGLLCATELQQAGLRVCVIDKGRGFGGRMATRRMDGARLDHGAQFLTVRDARLQDYVNDWRASGLLKEWYRHAPEDSTPAGYPRYCGLRGMTDVPKYLAAALPVCLEQQVDTLTWNKGQWEAHTLQGQHFHSHQLVLTAPLPQSLILLDTAGVAHSDTHSMDALRTVRYERGLATLAILDGPSGLPEPGRMKLDRPPLSWIADNQLKGISDVCALTLHANADFAQQHWSSPDTVRGPLMLEAVAPYITANVVDYKCHRWGFALAVNPWPERSYHDVNLQYTLAGDAFSEPRIEGAALSGIHAAHRLLHIL